jgi:hypothetical protein
MVGSQIREGNRTSILSETSHVSGAIALVGVNLVVLSLSLSWLLSCHGLKLWQKFSSDPLHWWGIVVVGLEKVSNCNVLVEKFSC